MFDVNLAAVATAAVSSFLLGGLWYSKGLFGRAWGRAAGLLDDAGNVIGGDPTKPPTHPHPARVFAVSLVFSLVAATAFAWWLGPAPALSDAVVRGLVVGACFVAASFGINYQFADRRTALWLIDGGYHTAQFTLFGLVLGLWH